MSKLCFHCKQLKSNEDFYKSELKKSSSECKTCSSDRNKKWRLANKEQRKKYKQQYYINNKESIDQRKKEWIEENKEYVSQLDKDRYILDKTRINKRNNDYYQKNRVAIRAPRNKKRLENLELFRQKDREYKATHPKLRMIMGLRKKVYNFLNSGKEYSELLGCDKETIYSWIGFNLQLSDDENMTEENYGSYWHLDHVIPVAKFNNDDDEHKKYCFHWSNLMPLEKSKNLSKSKKIHMEYINIRDEHLLEFCELYELDYNSIASFTESAMKIALQQSEQRPMQGKSNEVETIRSQGS
jgi:hypothetical protein